jgi:hypothetical protein
MHYVLPFFVHQRQIDWLSQETSEHEVELAMWHKLLEKYAIQVDEYITATNTLSSQTDTTGGKLIVPNLTAVHMVSTALFINYAYNSYSSDMCICYMCNAIQLTVAVHYAINTCMQAIERRAVRLAERLAKQQEEQQKQEQQEQQQAALELQRKQQSRKAELHKPKKQPATKKHASISHEADSVSAESYDTASDGYTDDDAYDDHVYDSEYDSDASE